MLSLNPLSWCLNQVCLASLQSSEWILLAVPPCQPPCRLGLFATPGASIIRSTISDDTSGRLAPTTHWSVRLKNGKEEESPWSNSSMVPITRLSHTNAHEAKMELFIEEEDVPLFIMKLDSKLKN